MSLPLVRSTDPDTSQLAAERVRRSRKELHRAIRRYVAFNPCSTQFEIAAGIIALHGDRWGEGTVRTAVSDAGVEVADIRAVSPRGGTCRTYYLPTIDTETL